jgi:hypothetical protein
MTSPELEKLLVEHLSDIDSAVKQTKILERRVFSEIDEMIKAWAARTTWSGTFDYIDDKLWLAPDDWRSSDETDKGDFQAWFELDVAAGDTSSDAPEEDCFYLTRLCGRGTGQVGFRFRQEIASKGRWRKGFKDRVGLVAATAFLPDAEPSFFLPMRLDSAELAEALLEQDIERALKPVERVLEQLVVAKPAFNRIIASLKAAEGQV